jgi:FHS family L-fucose permease-like MFS transporter
MAEHATTVQVQPPPAKELSSGKGPAGLLWVIFLSYFTFGMITNVIGVIIPEVIKQYQLSMFAAGFLAFSFFLAYGVVSIPTGLLMDRFGAKPLVLLGVGLMGLGCLVVARATTYPLMLAMIFGVGVGVTVLQTAGNPLIQHLDRPENYHRNLTLTIGFCGIGAFLGPFLLAFIRGTGRGWQTLYVLFALLSFLLFALIAISKFPVLGQSGDRFRFEQLGKLLKNPLILAYSLGVFFYVGAEVGTASWIVKFFESVHGLAADVSNVQATGFFGKFWPTLPAIVVALFWGAQGTGRLVSGAVLNRFGSRRILRVYSFLAMASLLVANFGSKNVTAVGFIACGFFTSVLITLVISGTINSFTENHGTISGLLCTAIVGGALLPPLVGWVGDHFGMHAAMIVPALAFAYVFVLSIFGRAKYE